MPSYGVQTPGERGLMNLFGRISDETNRREAEEDRRSRADAEFNRAGRHNDEAIARSAQQVDDYMRASNMQKRMGGLQGYFNYLDAGYDGEPENELETQDYVPQSQSQGNTAQKKQQQNYNNRGFLNSVDKNQIRALQRQLNVEDDGIVGPQTIKALQRKLGLEETGNLNDSAAKAIQRAVGATADGKIGSKTLARIMSNLGPSDRLESRGVNEEEDPYQAIFGSSRPPQLRGEAADAYQPRSSSQPSDYSDYEQSDDVQAILNQYGGGKRFQYD